VRRCSLLDCCCDVSPKCELPLPDDELLCVDDVVVERQ
jgi:hypothetical protein